MGAKPKTKQQTKRQQQIEEKSAGIDSDDLDQFFRDYQDALSAKSTKKL